jgi:hypothetical protein
MQTATQSHASLMYSQVQRSSSFYPSDKAENSSSPTQESEGSSSKPYQDSLSLSPAGKEIAKQQTSSTVNQEKSANQKPLTDEELVKLTTLKQRDTEVRTHEQAHLSAAGAYASGGASFSFTTGPNGKRYATSGEVPIDMSKEDTPAATILKMQTVRRAALAPANPSSADRAIASQASAKESQARKELQSQEKSSSKSVSEQNSEATNEENENNNVVVPEISDFSRSQMASAYQSMAALAS